MGWFDKMKTALGGHGVQVEALSVERQPVSGDIRFPLKDTVIKGQFRVNFGSNQEVLAHEVQFVAQKKHDNGYEEQIVLGTDRHDAKNQVFGAAVQPPYTAGPGRVVEDGFCIIDVDIPTALVKLGYIHPLFALNDEKVSFFVKITADVKGTILDADATVPVEVFS